MNWLVRMLWFQVRTILTPCAIWETPSVLWVPSTARIPSWIIWHVPWRWSKRVISSFSRPTAFRTTLTPSSANSSWPRNPIKWPATPATPATLPNRPAAATETPKRAVRHATHPFMQQPTHYSKLFKTQFINLIRISFIFIIHVHIHIHHIWDEIQFNSFNVSVSLRDFSRDFLGFFEYLKIFLRIF